MSMDHASPAQGPAPTLVRLALHGHIAQIELANPPLNLVTHQLLVDLHAVLDVVSVNQEVRCVVLCQGQARAFCAGSDMREFEAVAKHAAERKIVYEDFVLQRLAQLRCPTIAVLNGPALGGGLELALACDMRIASHGILLGLTECRIGGLAGSGTVRLTRLVGPARAAEMVFFGKTVDATLAHQWGLVNALGRSDELMDMAMAWAQDIAQRGPLSNTYAKQLITSALDQPAASALALANGLQEKIFQSQDLHKGAQAFFMKQSPIFEGQ
jgi:enoyl-CoA hydratase